MNSDDTAAIKEKMQSLAQSAMKVGEAMYKEQQKQQQAQDDKAKGNKDSNEKTADDVVDADFEEVKDKEQKK